MRRLRRLAASAVALLAAGACTVGPDYAPPRLQAPPRFDEARDAPGARSDGGEAQLAQWWRGFGDPVLDWLIARGLADNPGLDAAASRVRQARLQLRITAAAELPSLSASGNAVGLRSNRPSAPATSGAGSGAGGATGLTLPSSLSLFSAGFDASWEVDLFGGVRRAVEASRAEAWAAEWTRRDAQVTLISEIADDYLTLRALQARLAIGRAELQRQRDLATLVDARQRNGFVTNLDVNQQIGVVETAAAQIPQLEAQARAQTHALAVLVGQTPESLAVALQRPGALPARPPSLPVGLPSELLQRRPDIRAAERRLAAANARIGVQEAARFPHLNLLALGSFAGPSLATLFNADSLSGVGVAMASQPIFNGGRIGAGIGVAREQRRQASDDYRAAALAGFRDVEDALARYKAEESRRGNLEGAVEAAQGSLTIAQDQYRAGLVTFINVIQAESAVLHSQDQLVQSQAQSRTDLVALYKALGGGWSEASATAR